MAQDPEAQAIYTELLKRGVFHQDAEAQQIGHELRARGVVSDPTQGGLVASAPPPPVLNLHAPVDPYGSPTALPPGVAPRPLKGAPAYNDNNYSPGIRPAPHATPPPGFLSRVAADVPALIGGLKQIPDAILRITGNDPAQYGQRTLAGADAVAVRSQKKEIVNQVPPTVRDIARGVPPKQILANIGHEAVQHPLLFGVNAVSAAAPFAHGLGELGALGRAGRALSRLDINPAAEQFPELHPTAPVGPKGTLRAPSGKPVSPKAPPKPAARPLPTPAAVMDNIARGVQERTPPPAPALSPVEAAAATARHLVRHHAAQGVPVSPGELGDFLKSLHGLTDAEAAGVVQGVLPTEAIPPPALPPEPAAAPAQNAPPEAAGATETSAAPPAAVPGPVAPAPPAASTAPALTDDDISDMHAEWAGDNRSEEMLGVGEGTAQQRQSFNNAQAQHAAASGAYQSALRKLQSAGRGTGAPDKLAAAQSAYAASWQSVSEAKQGLTDAAAAISSSLKTRVLGQLSRTEPVDPLHPEPFVPPQSEGVPADPAPPEAPAPVAASPPPPARTPAEYAGSVNMDRLDASPEVTAKTRENVGDRPVPPTTIPEVTAKSVALGLQPEQLHGLTPGEVPSGVPMPDFVQAVRSLGKALGQKAVDAEAAHADAPSPETLQAVVDANQAHRAVLQHQQALATTFGQTGAVLASDTSAFQALREAADVKRQALAQASALKPLDVSAETGGSASPRASGYGSRNKVVTADAKEAALKRIQQSLGGVNSVADPSALLPAFKDMAIVGAYHLEAGLRQFGDWSAQMVKDVPAFGTLDDGRRQQVYAQARAEYAHGAKSSLKQTGQLVFADALAPRLGRKGARDFINAVADGPHPDLLGKLLAGDPSRLTPAEKQFVNDALRSNSPAKGRGVSQQSLSAVRAISKEFADRNRRAALLKARAARQAAAPAKAARVPKAPPDAVTKTIIGRLGKVNGEEFFRRIDPDTLDRLRTGQELTPGEQRAVAGHLEDMKTAKAPAPPSDASKALTKIAMDVKAGRVGYEDAKSAMMAELLPKVDQAQVPALTHEVAALAPDDFGGLAKVYNKYHPAGAGERLRAYQMNSLLSGPLTLGKIILSHGLSVLDEETGVRALAHAFRPDLVEGVNPAAAKYVVGAMRHSLEGARQHLTEGATAAHLRGMAPGYVLDKGGIAREPLQGRAAFLNAPMRLHGAIYHILGEGLEARGRFEAAGLKAKAQGGTAEQYLGDKDVVEAGHRFRQEQMFQNRNAAAAAVTAASRVHPLAEAATNALMPFREIPANIAGRGVESSGLGLPLGIARQRALKATGKDLFGKKPLTAEQRALVERNIAYQKARGIVGGAKVAAGAGLAGAGLLNGADAKKHEYGSVNAGRNKVGVSELGNVASPWLVGAALPSLAKGDPSGVFAPFLDNPISRTSDALSGMTEPGGVGKLAGSLTGQAIPTLLSQTAAAFDPSGQIRTKTDKNNFRAMLNVLRNRVPAKAGRYGLKESGYAQPSNVKSTGALSVLSPLPIEPRRGR